MYELLYFDGRYEITGNYKKLDASFNIFLKDKPNDEINNTKIGLVDLDLYKNNAIKISFNSYSTIKLFESNKAYNFWFRGFVYNNEKRGEIPVLLKITGVIFELSNDFIIINYSLITHFLDGAETINFDIPIIKYVIDGVNKTEDTQRNLGII